MPDRVFEHRSIGLLVLVCQVDVVGLPAELVNAVGYHNLLDAGCLPRVSCIITAAESVPRPLVDPEAAGPLALVAVPILPGFALGDRIPEMVNRGSVGKLPVVF